MRKTLLKLLLCVVVCMLPQFFIAHAATTSLPRETISEGITGGSITYEYDEETGEATVVCFGGSIVRATIPEHPRGGLTITAIGDKAFYGGKVNGISQDASNLLSVTLPDSIKSIGAQSFSGDSGKVNQIVEISLPKSLSSIGNKAFSGCTKLKTVDMRGITLENMGTEVFKDCSFLTGISTGNDISEFSFPDGLNAVPKGTFSGCSRLQHITNLDNINTIGDSAFYKCIALDTVTLPKSITDIGISAFEGCTKLAALNGCTGLESIGKSAFKGCTGLASIPNTGYHSTLRSVGAYAFQNCTSLREFIVPENLTNISSYCFSGCTLLQNIKFPEGVTSIGSYAFQNCHAVTELKIPDSLSSVGDYAYAGCGGLTNVSLCGNSLELIGKGAFNKCTALSTVDISTPRNLMLGNEAFINSSVRKATIDAVLNTSSTNYKAEGAFSGCSLLEEANIPQELTNIPKKFFYKCPSLVWNMDKLLPDYVYSIGESAYEGCTFKSVTLSKNIESVGKRAFAANTALETFIADDKLATLGVGALIDCSSLTKLTLNNGLELVGDSTFEDCSSLTQVTVPKTVTYMGNAVFKNCSSLTGVELPKALEAVTENMFNNCASLTSIDLRDTKVTALKDSAFAKCSSLTSVKWNNYITSINKNAFQNCTSLESLTLPRSMVIIDEGAFNGCSALQELNLNEGLTVIGNTVFKGCKSLKGLFLPTSVAKIGNQSFSGCIGLSTLIIPKSVETLGSTILQSCTQPITIYCEENSAITRYAFASNNDITFAYTISIPDTIAGKVFNLELYTGNNPEIAECFANKPEYMYLHWVSFGQFKDSMDIDYPNKEASEGSYVFNAADYAYYNPDVVAEVGDSPSALFNHFATTGYKENRIISRKFSIPVYSRLHPDTAKDKLIELYLANGMTEDAFTSSVGDVNSDGEIDSRDTLRLMKHLAGYNVVIDLSAADINGDGEIDSRDTLRLMKYIAGMVSLL